MLLFIVTAYKGLHVYLCIMSLQANRHTRACGLAVSPSGLPETDGNGLRVRGSRQHCNIFIFKLCVCVCVLVHTACPCESLFEL